MRFGVLAFSVGLSCGLAACGGVVTFENDPPSGEPGGSPGDPSPAAVTCEFDASSGSDRGVLAWIRGRDVVLVRADGTSIVPYSFAGAEGSTPQAFYAQLVSRDGFVAATGTSYGDDGTYETETVLLSGKGEVLWTSGVFPSGYGYQYLGEKGTLAISSWGPDGTTSVVAWPSGKSAEVPGVVPIGGPSAAGRFPALLTPDSYMQEFGWSAPGVASEPLGYEAYSSSYPMESEGKLSYVAFSDVETGAALFVSESEKAITSFPFTSTSPHIGSVAGPFAVVRGDWIWDAPQYLADTLGGTFTNVPLPAGVYALGMAYYNGATVDDQGGVSLVARNASAGGMYRTTDAGKSWKRVGKSFSNVWDAAVVARGGTFVVAANDMAGYFPMDPWEAPAAGEAAADVTGPSVEVVRPSEGFSRSLDPAAASFVLSKSGGCLAYTANDQLRVLSVASGQEIEVDEIDPTFGFTPPVWID